MNISLRPRAAGLGDAAWDALFANFSTRAVDPVMFSTRARPGRTPPNPLDCLKIQCGVLSQSQAGPDLLADCSFGGFAGSRTCYDPLCSPFCGKTGESVARGAQPLPVGTHIAAVFLNPPAESCTKSYGGPNFGGPYGEEAETESCGFSEMVCNHPLVSLAVVFGGAWLIRMARERKTR